MKGYYEGYSYVMIMPNGRKLRIATDSEVKDYVEEDNYEKEIDRELQT